MDDYIYHIYWNTIQKLHLRSVYGLQFQSYLTSYDLELDLREGYIVSYIIQICILPAFSYTLNTNHLKQILVS